MIAVDPHKAGRQSLSIDSAGRSAYCVSRSTAPIIGTCTQAANRLHRLLVQLVPAVDAPQEWVEFR
ncbi:hypothetical protein [Nocardia sp. CA-290969]|uniref:hypothetical protein n=1 Tax=Nocardia sp. CA-290969 TaxID=3239986 RepID=UPI003D8B4027